MNLTPASPLERAELYAKSRQITIDKPLGSGYDGEVLSTSGRTALKVFRFHELYRRELAVYFRFQERGFSQADEFKIPRLIDFSETLGVIEMTIVSPPFIVDFAGATLDRRVEYPPEVLEAWVEAKQEEFEANWPKVKRALWKFEAIGVYLNDVAPRNVHCG